MEDPVLLVPPAIIEPDDGSDYGGVARAAAALRLGQYDLFRLAYRRWHGSEGSRRLLEREFGRYLTAGKAPFWVRHLARDLHYDGADRERFGAGDLPRRDGLPTAPPTLAPSAVFLAALVVYLALLL